MRLLRSCTDNGHSVYSRTKPARQKNVDMAVYRKIGSGEGLAGQGLLSKSGV
jgi:hypothetical protein